MKKLFLITTTKKEFLVRSRNFINAIKHVEKLGYEVTSVSLNPQQFLDEDQELT